MQIDDAPRQATAPGMEGGERISPRTGLGAEVGTAADGQTKAEGRRQEMDAVVERSNLWQAYERVLRNKGAAGVDGLTVLEFKAWLQQHWPSVKAALLAGDYLPAAIRKVELPKPNGGVRILGILGNPDLEYVRFWMMTHCRIIASIDLHPDTFQPNNGTQTSVLLLQKKTDAEMRKEEKQRQLDDYEIFMAQTLAIGHDKRGNVLYRRNEDGEEILFPSEGEETELYEVGAKGDATRRVLRPSKQVDDDAPVVAQEFLEWKKLAVLGW